MSETTSWPRRRILTLSAAGAAALLLVGGGAFAAWSVLGQAEPAPQAVAPPAPAPAPVVLAPIELPQKKGPADQQAFLAAIEAGRAALAKAGAAMEADRAPQLEAIRARRAQALCTALKDGPPHRWVGTIAQVGLNGDKRGTLTIQIAPGISVKTWNTAPADAGYDTLLDPKSVFFQGADLFGRGQQVVFSGRFFPAQADCVSLSTLNPASAVAEPAFIMQFEELRPLGPVKSLQALNDGKSGEKAAKGDQTGSTAKH
ncbi:hypothetical protein [Aquabacter cavernae]|uniref:hypothetical protein n=1 Tax=Aquabacter cavernae TaxID=2496029 RepID=UPI000F8F1C80|nr:hypothetical protein [Aquabacter cavernae]